MDLQDVYAIEGEAETEDEYYEAIQRAINGGNWSLQGSYGRAMMDAIECGQCLLGKHGARDYWGSYIPSRDEVQSGTKGSFEYVSERSGADHAAYMASI